MSKPTKLLIIVGCPRSGTSLFADFLVQCGLRTVSDHRNNEQYPRGYHEYFPLLMFHKALERYPRGADHRITDIPFLQSSYLEDEYTSQMFIAATAPFWDKDVDFLKFPQLALSIDFLFEQFQDIHIIALWRNPAAVFKSLVQKEFPLEMRPASGIKAILLQSVYGFHIKKAISSNPGKVSILSIDNLIEEDMDLEPFLKSFGYSIGKESRLSHSMNSGLWTKRVPIHWYLYFLIMRLVVLIGSPILPSDKRKFVQIGKIHRTIIGIINDNINPHY